MKFRIKLGKRFENRLNKNNENFKALGPVWDKEINDALNLFEMIDLLNALHEENYELKQLLEEIRHEITCIDGLNAFDKGAWYLGYVEVFNKNIIDLNYGELLKKIDKVIK